MATNKIFADIISGPGKFELMLSCFEGKKVTFRIRQKDTGLSHDISAIWVGVSAESGDGKQWLIELHNTQKGNFKGYYKTTERKPGKSCGFLTRI